MVSEKLGASRFGEANLFQNYGITFIATLVLISTIVLLLTVLLCLCRASCCQSKCRKLMERAKAKLLYNPLIRYAYMNCCKLNITALLVFAHPASQQSSRVQLVVAVLTFALINLLPFFFARVLKKYASRLQEAHMLSSIGNMYSGKRLDK